MPPPDHPNPTHPISARAHTAFTNALHYDAHRPSYPPASLTPFLPTAPGSRILDLGAGTGKLTAQLAALPERHEILAVEPHAAMRAVLERKQLPGVRVLDGTATKMPVESGWADAVVVAQAFHWFANGEALREIRRCLKKGGVLGLVWNLEDYNSDEAWDSATKWEDIMKKITRSHDVDEHRARLFDRWKGAFEAGAEGENTKGLFKAPLEHQTLRWTTWLERDAVWERYSTLSQISTQEPGEYEETKRIVYEAMHGDDAEVNSDGLIALHGRTETYWTTALDMLNSPSSTG